MNVSISLTPELVGMIKAKVEGGRYSSTSEVVREALRLMERMEQREAEQNEYLRQAWCEGIASGDAGELDARIFGAHQDHVLAGDEVAQDGDDADLERLGLHAAEHRPGLANHAGLHLGERKQCGRRYGREKRARSGTLKIFTVDTRTPEARVYVRCKDNGRW